MRLIRTPHDEDITEEAEEIIERIRAIRTVMSYEAHYSGRTEFYESCSERYRTLCENLVDLLLDGVDADLLIEREA